MILAMMVVYIVALHLVFNVFKWVSPSTRNKIYVAVFGCFLIYCILLVINVFQPMSTDLRVMRAVVPMRPRVDGIVSEVAVKPNTPVKAGEVLFKLDGAPFEARVNSLKAALAEAEQAAKTLPINLAAAEAAVSKGEASVVDARQQASALGASLMAAEATVSRLEAELALSQANYERSLQAGSDAVAEEEIETRLRTVKAAEAGLKEAQASLKRAQLAFESKIGDVNTVVVLAENALLQAKADKDAAQLAVDSTINGENTTVARIRAELKSAELDLRDSVVYAPADGYVTDLALRPGQAIKASERAVLSFVNTNEYALIASFKQEVLNRINSGQEVEMAFDDLPGKTFSGSVKNVNWGIPQGQLLPSGELMSTATEEHGKVFVQFALNDPEGMMLPAGGAGAATIYTDGGKPFVPVRKVFFRWYTWLNYLDTDMDIRGKRQQ